MATPQLKQSYEPAARVHIRYAHVLRCIGQSLESLDLKSLELKTHGDTYVVQAWNRGVPVSKEVD